MYIEYATGTMDNTKEMLSMMAVRMNQDLDLETNPKVKLYLQSLFDESHYFTTSERDYKCAGCEENYYECDGCETDAYECDGCEKDEEGNKFCPGHSDSYCPGHTEMICPGHTNLTINITLLGFDDIFAADRMGNAGQDAVNGELIGTFEITHYGPCLPIHGDSKVHPYRQYEKCRSPS